ncbi:ribonuclease H-like domain-containing protein [Tanacetum coccineum]
MKTSTIPHAFLTSRYTWHQRLGHPASEVLRHLLSRYSISCTKEKPPILCHACQLGKHLRLPFVSFNMLADETMETASTFLVTLLEHSRDDVKISPDDVKIVLDNIKLTDSEEARRRFAG